MAKALYGHMALPDRRLLAEVEQLRRRVRELEARVEQLELERSLDLSGLDQRVLAPAAG